MRCSPAGRAALVPGRPRSGPERRRGVLQRLVLHSPAPDWLLAGVAVCHSGGCWTNPTLVPALHSSWRAWQRCSLSQESARAQSFDKDQAADAALCAWCWTLLFGGAAASMCQRLAADKVL